MSTAIGKRIQQLRKHQKITQKALVGCNFSSTYVSQVENSQKEPSEKFLLHICKQLNISLDDLLEKDIQKSETEIITMVADFWEQLTLTEEHRSFLQLHAHESHRPVLLVKIFGVLLYDDVERGFIEEAERLHDRAKALLPEELKGIEDPFACMVYYHSCGQLFFMKQDFMQANTYMMKAMCYLQNDDESMAAVRLLSLLSAVKQRIHNDMSVPLQYAYRVYDILSKSPDEKRFVHAALHVGAQHRLSGHFDYAKKFYKEAQDYAVKLSDLYVMAHVYYHYGLLYKAMQETVVAKSYLLKSLALQRELKVDEKERVYALKALLVLAIEEKKWGQVDGYLSEVSAIIEQHQERLIYIDIEMQVVKAQRCLYQGDSLTYEREMGKIIEYAISRKQYKLVCRFAEQLGRYYQGKRAYKKAAKYLMCACDYRY